MYFNNNKFEDWKSNFEKGFPNEYMSQRFKDFQPKIGWLGVNESYLRDN